jgi:hypothetical protein
MATNGAEKATAAGGGRGMMVGPVGSFSSPLQRNIYFAVVVLIVIFAGPVAGRRGGQGGMRTALVMIVIALVLGAILAYVR